MHKNLILVFGLVLATPVAFALTEKMTPVGEQRVAYLLEAMKASNWGYTYLCMDETMVIGIQIKRPLLSRRSAQRIAFSAGAVGSLPTVIGTARQGIFHDEKTYVLEDGTKEIRLVTSTLYNPDSMQVPFVTPVEYEGRDFMISNAKFRPDPRYYLPDGRLNTNSTRTLLMTCVYYIPKSGWQEIKENYCVHWLHGGL
ncbi:MAG: hypothetical protein KF799_06660 [Bdellovibrionales bacterium]|nr:hypothetical protein [Bdellovibrionales bacterium]